MRKYIWKRIGFSVFSLIVVVLTVMLLVYSLIDRNVIFQTDDVWNKRSNNERSYYEFTMFQKFGYLEFVNYTNFVQKKYMDVFGDDYVNTKEFISDRAAIQKAETYQENPTVQEFINYYTSQGYVMKYYEPLLYGNGRQKPGGTAYLLAVREKNQFSRLWNYIKGLISIETTKDVEDENLTDRYIRVEKDPYNGFFALVGSGTTHKYLVYFDSRFPFMHWNWIHINMGVSFTKYRGQEISGVITDATGDLRTVKAQFPTKIGSDEYVETAIDFHNLTYTYGEISELDRANYPDNYTSISYRRTGLSMLENSFVIGIIATVLAYMIGLPLGVLNAKKKDSWADKLGMWYIIFIGSVPSLAYIFMFAAVGTRAFNLPYKFATAEVKILAYILPTISLALPHIGSLMKWMRRYMIDQMNSDYVKFARAEGLSESEIFSKHIARNAVIPIIHGIPASVLGCLTGAIITERVYSVPGVGNLLTTAINGHDNGIIVACAMFYTTLSLIALICGDLLMAKWDPRISFETKGGR